MMPSSRVAVAMSWKAMSPAAFFSLIGLMTAIARPRSVPCWGISSPIRFKDPSVATKTVVFRADDSSREALPTGRSRPTLTDGDGKNSDWKGHRGGELDELGLAAASGLREHAQQVGLDRAGGNTEHHADIRRRLTIGNQLEDTRLRGGQIVEQRQRVGRHSRWRCGRGDEDRSRRSLHETGANLSRPQRQDVRYAR